MKTGPSHAGSLARLCSAGMIALVILPGLGACHDTTRRPTDSSKETSMDDPLRTLDQHPGIAISIRQGTEHFRNGLVTLIIHGNGTVGVDQLRAGKAAHYEKQLPPDRIRDLGRQLAEHRVSAPRKTSLPRQPGDTPLVLRVEGAGPAPFQADVWYGDRYKDSDLDAIIRLADTLVNEVGGAAIGSP
jgi:hypothetical protein